MPGLHGGPALGAANPRPGRPTRTSGAAQLAYIDVAYGLVRTGVGTALVTGPVSKQAIARSGAPGAARRAALPLLPAARRVGVLAGGAAPAAPGLVPFDIDAWARCHQVEVEYLAMDRDEDVGAALLAAAGEVSADLLVAGAYGRSRLAEWALGGVTRHLIRHATIPLLLRH